MAVQIVTDSAAALPAELAADLGIRVVPLLLRIDGREIADGDVPLDELMAIAPERVSTSGATPGAFLDAFRATRADADGILVLTIARSMSSTNEAANLAAAEAGRGSVALRVIDTATAAGAEGIVAVHAARAARNGLDLDAVERAARAAIDGVRLVATVDALDRLIASGRARGSRGARGGSSA